MSDDEQLFTVTDAAALAGIAPITVKKYEADGLITPRRDSRGTRLFTLADVEKIRRLNEQRTARHGKTGARRRLIIATSTVTGNDES